MVINGDTSHTGKDLNEFEMQIRNALQGLGPIGPDVFLSFNGARGVVHQFDNEGRGHLEVLSIVGHYPLQIMGVPGVHPFMGKCASTLL
jgi:hypothetical protein